MEDKLKSLKEEIRQQNAQLDEIFKAIDKILSEVKMLTMSAVVVKDELKSIKKGKKDLNDKLNSL